MEQTIKDFYIDPKTGFQSYEKLFKKLKKINPEVTRKDVKKVLDKSLQHNN